MEWNGMEWIGMQRNGINPRGMEWNGVDWNGMEWKDRKSTRLNSSHLVISYAVFCLKKQMHPDERQSVHAAGQAAIAQGRRFDIEHPVVWLDVTVRWVHEQGPIVLNTRALPARMICT